MASLDYFVATMARTKAIEAIEPNILARFRDGKKVELYGYTGVTSRKITYAVSRDGLRSLIAGTGTVAHDAATLFFSLATKTESISIARIDVQETIRIIDPDRTIAFLSPKRVYKATRISAVNDEGETLYVGSPHSRARLRIYNKSAESGLVDGDMKFLRIEVQLRDVYADIAYRKWQDGKLDEVISFWLKKMLTDASARDMLKLAEMFNTNVSFDVGEHETDWLERRKVWFERCVVPAMAKLFIADPDYTRIARRMLLGEDLLTTESGAEKHNWTHDAKGGSDEC